MGEFGEVASRNRPTPLHPALQMGQLHRQHGGLDRIEATVVTQIGVQVAARHPVHCQLAHPLGQLGIAAGHRTAIAGTAEVLGGEETEAAGIAPAAHRPSGPVGAAGLGAVLDHQQSVGGGDRVDALHVHRPAEQVHWQQGAGGGGDGRLDPLGIDQIGATRHIHEHRDRPHGTDRLGGGKKTEGTGDHLVTGPDPQGPQGQDQGIGAAVAADRMGNATELGEGLLKAGDGAPTDVLTTAQHGQHSLLKAGSEVLQLLAEAEGRYRHGGNLNPVHRMRRIRTAVPQRAHAGAAPEFHSWCSRSRPSGARTPSGPPAPPPGRPADRGRRRGGGSGGCC